MAITKRMSLSFTASLVLSTAEVEEFTQNLIDTSKKIMAGEKVSFEERKLAEIAVTEGVEKAIEFALKRQARAGWSALMKDIDLTKCSPLNIRYIK